MPVLPFDVDRSSPVPLYFQVAQQIEAAIDSGTLAPGDRLENEVALADRLGLSRPTMRQAIQSLVERGLLVRRRGVGTQVVQGRVRRPVRLSSLHDDLVRSGQHPTTTVLLHETGPAPAEVALTLGLAPGTDVVTLGRLRCVDDGPLAVLHNWLPADLLPADADLTHHGLYEVLRAQGVHLRVASQQISAEGADAETAGRLGLDPGAPVLVVERTCWDDSGRAVEFARHHYRADGYTVEMTLVDP
ncbi:GntR family transcriptional regulator [Modestobacter sp. CPCC 205119]|uniref:GntR family transcriptional regulator n=1 Tax=Goekera deserti TaxID=2497753 RepID=A0A7K3W9I1_9ACTN|nr:GntR family transcriptional regulator [Goekera deserti]